MERFGLLRLGAQSGLIQRAIGRSTQCQGSAKRICRKCSLILYPGSVCTFEVSPLPGLCLAPADSNAGSPLADRRQLIRAFPFFFSSLNVSRLDALYRQRERPRQAPPPPPCRPRCSAHLRTRPSHVREPPPVSPQPRHADPCFLSHTPIRLRCMSPPPCSFRFSFPHRVLRLHIGGGSVEKGGGEGVPRGEGVSRGEGVDSRACDDVPGVVRHAGRRGRRDGRQPGGSETAGGRKAEEVGPD